MLLEKNTDEMPGILFTSAFASCKCKASDSVPRSADVARSWLVLVLFGIDLRISSDIAN